MPTATVNSQVTDAVTQTNVKVLGESPAEAVGLTYQSYSNSVSLALENAMTTQGGMQQVANASTSSVCTMIIKAGASG
ncbi:RebB family R body protein [Kordiimonas marina]|uniref:RebB family R body protein n=1 Tax=Kordiimonas marina TaxID=2872312 RepID=UPI001FF41067|nr:RebB family R body protein [Kordiimonas marina]MCJ9429355.1 RebB family R body protein [Kordiimonas marina]